MFLGTWYLVHGTWKFLNKMKIYFNQLLIFHSSGLWKTRLTEDTDEDRELYVKTTLRELAIYVGFITILCICKYLMITREPSEFILSHLFFVQMLKCIQLSNYLFVYFSDVWYDKFDHVLLHQSDERYVSDQP